MARPLRILLPLFLLLGCPTPASRRDTGTSRDTRGSGCPRTQLAATQGRPSVVWVVEHSCGAALRLDGQPSTSATDAQSRFVVAADAIRRAQERFADTFTWGLLVHPGDPAMCDSSSVLNVEPSDESRPRVLTELARADVNAFNYCAAHARSGSGLGDALSALAETNLADAEQAAVVVIGMSAPTCGSMDATVLSAQTGGLADLGYVLPVIQLGSSADAAESLEAVASRGGGGTASEAPFRFRAADGASLDSAITSALMATSACVFSVAEAADLLPEEVVVTADGEAVPVDAEDGYGYWPPDATVTLRGSYCRRLLEGSITTLRVERARCAS